MKFDKNFLQNLLGKWTQKLIGRIRSASLLSRITGGAFFATLLIWMLVPSYARYLWTIILMAAGVLYVGSILLHSTQRMSEANDFRRNPFTVPLLVLLAATVFCCIYPFGSPSYDFENEPINQIERSLQSYAAHSDKLPQAVKSGVVCDLFKDAGVNYNLLLLDENGTITAAATKWMAENGQTVYPLISPSYFQSYDSFIRSEDVHLMVLVNQAEQVIGTFQLPREELSSSGTAGYLSLTIDSGITDSTDKYNELQARYFPSFGNMIDKFTMQLCQGAEIKIADSSAVNEGRWVQDSRTGEMIREQGVRYISFFEWNGEPIEDITGIDNIIYSKYGHILFSESDLIAELNALDETDRNALKNHIKWLGAAVANTTHTEKPLRAKLFSVSSTQQIVLLYEDSYRLYPLRKQWVDQDAADNLLQLFAWGSGALSWILLAFWVFADAKKRGHEHPALWGILTMIGSVITLIIYHMVRPKLRVDKEGKKQPKGLCPLCGAVIKDDYIACPGCGVPIRCTCPSCGHALENDWNFCPYCSLQIAQPVISSEDMPIETESADAEVQAEEVSQAQPAKAPTDAAETEPADAEVQAEEVSQAQPAQAPTDAANPEPDGTIGKDASQADGSSEA